MRSSWFIVLCSFYVASCIEHDFKGFDDSILFSIRWPGTLESSTNGLVEGEVTKQEDLVFQESMKVTTSHKEKYECLLPQLQSKEWSGSEDYSGPSPLELLKPLFVQRICSYRLESYWSYEVCHGRYIRQYHDVRDGSQVKTQEYYLGHWGIEKQLKLETDMKATPDTKEKYHTTKVDGIPLPYVEMVMEHGTLCDLNEKHRLTRVRYVCYTHGKHEVHSFKETSTCEYEIIILSPLLCEHPLFKPKEVGENIINCLPLDGAPKEPRSLMKMEVESLKFQHQTVSFEREKEVLAVWKVEKIDKDGLAHIKLELQPLSEIDEATAPETNRPLIEKQTPVISDDSPVRAFLNGENCLNGGTGWWKYEFCYGRFVAQYHVDRGGERTALRLGSFSRAAHLAWLHDNPTKQPKPKDQRTSISHFYSNGDLCDKTGKPRQTEVKLKCLENASSPSQVSLYLLEPRTCHYILGVESPLICEILPLADEYGLISKDKLSPEKAGETIERVNTDEPADKRPKETIVQDVGND